MTLSEFYTTQFYTWEFRGRGWLLSEHAVHLEPPFIPFFRHGFAHEQIDDGKRHSVFSTILEGFNGKPKPIFIEQPALDYETVEPYLYEDEYDLTGLQIKLPKERKITPEKMKALLIMLSSITSIISFEIIATDKEIIVQFVCNELTSDIVETYVGAYFPSCTVIKSDVYVDGILHPDSATMVVDFGLKHEFVRPINTAKGFGLDPLIGILAVCERLTTGERAGFQILVQPTCNQWSTSMLRSVTMQDGSSFFTNASEAPQLAHEKVQSPLYGVTIRAFAQADTLDDAERILAKLSYALVIASKGAYNELIPLVHQAYDFDTRVDDIFLRQSHRLGMLLNADELITFLHLPSESINSKKLYACTRKTKEVPAIARNKVYVLGENNHHGISTDVTIGIDERLKHTHIIGATGTGKSTLIANLMLQDIKEGNATILFDPHGDLVDDVIARIPAERLNDVVLIDPSDIEHPIALNILQAHSDIEKEVLSSDLVASFRKYATSWGDQMSSVLGNAILALLESKQGGTLNDLRRFLIEKDYRTTFLRTVTDPSVLYYWQKEFTLLKSNSIGPIITRLDTFLRTKSIRNMVIQQEGVNFEKLIEDNKIVLLKLSQGLIGAENSYLLGSLVLSKIHQAILRRQQQINRKPVFIYVDEFQNFMTPSIKEMISGIRKYYAGLTLSHQDLQQLQREDGELLNSVIGNINTRIVFRVGEPDAKKLQDGFSSFDHTDLQNLGRGEAIVRIEQPQYDCSLDTIPLQEISNEEKEQNIAQVIYNSREQYAATREEVEKKFFETLLFETTPPETKESKPKERPKEQPASAPEQPVSPPQSKQEQYKSAPAKPALDTGKEKDLSTHRYLQTLVKKMAEARGYTATIEQQLPNGTGTVDVLLTKDNKAIAVEICITTDAGWETHNIEKCITANYTTVVSLTTDAKQLEKIKKKCMEHIPGIATKDIHFFTPDGFFAFLDIQPREEVQTETTMKGYRVNVTYDSISEEEMERKRASVAKVVMDSLRKRKKD